MSDSDEYGDGLGMGGYNGESGSLSASTQPSAESVAPPQPSDQVEDEQPEDDDPYGENWQPAGGQGQQQQQQAPPPQQYQQQAPPQHPEATAWDAALLNPQTKQAYEIAIHSQFDGRYRQAATAAEQQSIQREYQAAIATLNTATREAQLRQHEAYLNQREQQLQRDMVPMARRFAIDELAKRHGLSPSQVAKDAVTGEPIWDPHLMRKQAEWLSQSGTRARVQQRQRSGADRSYSPSGGGLTGQSIRSMSSEKFAELEARVRRTGGRALYDLPEE